MLNYYKILGIENFADINKVKLAYKEKIRKYHPDLNNDPDAAEISKYLNQAKDQLTNDKSKAEYDSQLRLAYLHEIKRISRETQERTWMVRSRMERRRKMEEEKKLEMKVKYERGIDSFPLTYRMGIIMMASISGLVLFYRNYFLNLTGNEAILAFLGILVFMLAIVTGADQMYKYFWYRSMEKIIKFNYEKRILRSLGISMVLGPLLVISLNSARKNYLLANNYEFFPASVITEESRDDYIMFEYKINGVWYKKGQYESIQNTIKLGNNRIVIKYAKPDPRIVEIVERRERENLPIKL